MAKLTYLQWLTDDFGIWQHTKGDTIHREMGYALDDAARGLIVYLRYGDRQHAQICLDYLERSQTPAGFVGFYNGKRRALDKQSSDDAHALALWALAESINAGFKPQQALRILTADQPNSAGLIQHGYTRTLAYLLLAYCALGDRAHADTVASLLTERFDKQLGWFEERLTYANAVLPWSLLRYQQTFTIKKTNLARIITQSIATLEDYCRLGVLPAPVGNRIWQRVGAVERDIYGQQPIDPGFMVLLLAEASQAYRSRALLQQATDWLQWFYGNNIYQASLIRSDNACGDGLYALPRGVCNNKGAESTIMYLLALHAYEAAGGKTKRITNDQKPPMG